MQRCGLCPCRAHEVQSSAHSTYFEGTGIGFRLTCKCTQTNKGLTGPKRGLHPSGRRRSHTVPCSSPKILVALSSHNHLGSFHGYSNGGASFRRHNLRLQRQASRPVCQRLCHLSRRRGNSPVMGFCATHLRPVLAFSQKISTHMRCLKSRMKRGLHSSWAMPKSLQQRISALLLAPSLAVATPDGSKYSCSPRAVDTKLTRGREEAKRRRERG